MANASSGLHDAYESAYWVWRKTFSAAPSPGPHLAVLLHSRNNAVLILDRRPVSRRTEAVCVLDLTLNAYVSCHNAYVSLM